MIAAGSAADTHAGAWFQEPNLDGIGRILIDRKDDPVNALDDVLIASLGDAIRSARSSVALRGLLVESAKPGQWIAGADLKLVARHSDPLVIRALSQRFQAVCDQLAWLPCTTVAVITGPALGGGFEVALACDYRVAADVPAVSLGQPEVSLGLVPAGGGTQRLPRLVGLAVGLDYILAARRFTAQRGRRAGLIDEVVHSSDLSKAALAWVARPKRLLSSPVRATLNLAEHSPVGRAFIYRQARASARARTHGHYPALLRAIDAVEIGMEHGMAAGLEAESRAFAELAGSATTRHLIWLFLATQRQKRELGVDSKEAGRAITTVGVVGSGFMGAGIAHVSAAAGYGVRVRDAKPGAVALAMAQVRRLVAEATARRRIDRHEAERILQRVSGTVDYTGFRAVELAIEAVVEDISVKRTVIAELEAVVPPTTVIATNTSALLIRDIAAGSAHPERIVGMHFFSPVHRMPLIEVVRSELSSDLAIATTVAAGNRMGKTVIVVSDGPGFYTSRVLGVMMNEATHLLLEGARMGDVDNALTNFGFPVGPFVLYDEVGLEVAAHVGITLSASFGDRHPVSDIVARLVAAGRTGKRSGAGFYAWHPERNRLPIPLRLAGLPLFSQKARHEDDGVARTLLGNPEPRSIPFGEMQQRLVLILVNESIRCLQEQVVRSPTDGDIGAVLGIGFPPFFGGPFHYADSLGLPALEAMLNGFAVKHGERYRPAVLLADNARAGRSFYPA